MSNLEQTALDQCDKEPIHIPGSIQGFGCLLAAERESNLVAAISENCNEVLGRMPEQCLGQDVADLFPPELIHAMGNKLSYSTISDRRELAGSIAGKSAKFDVYVHLSGEYNILEIVSEAVPKRGIQDRVASITAGMQIAGSLQEIFDLAVANIQSITEFDRVLFYRFMPDDAGEVVSEQRTAQMESYLGLRFPAWDIPVQARKLYATTPIRVIADVAAPNKPLRFAAGTEAKDIDLAKAMLRGTSPVHLEYLSNMNVGSTLTVPIVVDGKLWGLVACHNEKPIEPQVYVLDAAETAGKILSFGIAQFLKIQATEFGRTTGPIRNDFIGLQTGTNSLGDFTRSVSDRAAEEIDFAGFAVRSSERWFKTGAAPSDLIDLDGITDLHTIDSEIAPISFCNKAMNALSTRGASGLAGFLRVPVSDDPPIEFVFFRAPQDTHIEWGGAPDKTVSEDDEGVRLSPRKSFRKYLAEHADFSEEWTHHDLEFARNLQSECADSFSAALTITQQKTHLRILADELNHRVKNILSLVKSLTSQSQIHTKSAQEYAQSLERRLFSLAASHDLLTRADMQGVELRELVKAELEPFLTPAAQARAISGPALKVAADAIPMAALLVHELTANATKHGALSCAGGAVTVSWEICDQQLILNWQERGGPQVAEPKRRGFGMELLQYAIPYEFDGKAELDFAPEGFSARYALPIKHFLSQSSETEDTVPEAEEDVSMTASEPGQSALVVEDSYLIAAEHIRMLESMGFAHVECASNISAALDVIKDKAFDLVLLDLNLRGDSGLKVADELLRQNAKFLFVSGYERSDEMPDRFAKVPMLRKPLNMQELRNRV